MLHTSQLLLFAILCTCYCLAFGDLTAGILHLQSRNFNSAASEFQQDIVLHPNDPVAISWLLVSHFEAGNVSDAQSLIDATFEPLLGNQLLAQYGEHLLFRKYLQLHESCKQVLGSGTCRQTQYFLCEMAYFARQFVEAEARCGSLVESSDTRLSLTRLIQIYMTQGRLEEAASGLQRYLALPSEGDTFWNQHEQWQHKVALLQAERADYIQTHIPYQPSRPLRKVLCSLAASIPGYSELLRYTSPTWMLYASLHQYDIHIERQARDPSEPIQWSRIKMIQELLQEYDIVLWLDADVFITNVTLDIVTMLRPGKDTYLVAHEYETATEPMLMLNTGVMLFRSSASARRLLSVVQREEICKQHVYHDRCGFLNVLGFEWAERDPISGTYSTWKQPSQYAEHVQLLGTEWNTVYGGSKQLLPARFRHYGGLHLYQKILHARWDLQRAQASSLWGTTWEMDIAIE